MNKITEKILYGSIGAVLALIVMAGIYSDGQDDRLDTTSVKVLQKAGYQGIKITDYIFDSRCGRFLWFSSNAASFTARGDDKNIQGIVCNNKIYVAQ